MFREWKDKSQTERKYLKITSDKGLVYRTYKEIQKLNSIAIAQIKSGLKIWIGISPKKLYTFQIACKNMLNIINH